MATDYLNKNGLSYFWSKLKAYFAPKAHTHNAFEVKHSYTTAANAAKNWYRIANASTQQLDTSKPIHAQFILTAYNTSYAADYYERWFVNVGVFGRTANIVIFGATSVPFSQARVLYENTVADIDVNDRPALDIYLNYVLPNGTTKIEIEEVYNNGGWTFVADGQLAASTVPSGFENVACSVRNNGVERSTYADFVPYLNRQVSNFTAAFTLADSYLYRSRTLNCTGTFTITIPSINSGYMWCVIKNKNAASGVITLHPSTTSVLIDGSNADIALQPMEYVCIHSAGANNYSLIADGRWKSQKADKATTLSGYGITDAKIVNGTITLGSDSITPLTSVPSHNQASDTITAMTGYSKPSSASAISTSDTLNQAIGKLEKSIDDADISNVVHRTGDESIAGVKTFTDILYATNSDADSSAIRIHCDALDVASLPSVDKYANIHFLDVNGIQLGRLLLYKNSDGQTGMGISVKQHNSSSGQTSYDASLSVRIASDGTGLAFCPTPPSNSNTSAIATTEWVNGAPTVVHTSGDETISGTKTFNNSIHEKIAYYLYATTVEYDKKPAENQYSAFVFRDKNSNPIARVMYSKEPSGICRLFLNVANHNYNDFTDSAYFGIVTNPDYNTGYANAPTFEQWDSNSNVVATTYWVRHATGNTSLNAASATALKTARDFRVDLASSSSASFDGTASCSPGVKNVLPVANGGTGSSTKNFVDLSTSQDISGIKTFKTGPYVQNDSADINVTPSTDNLYWSYNFKDKDGDLSARMLHWYNAGGNRGLALSFSKKGSSSSLVTIVSGDLNPSTNKYTVVVGSSDCTAFRPAASGITLGTNSTANRWGQIYSSSTSISTSDERVKTSFASVPDAVLDAWDGVSWIQFQMKDSVERKGASARLHNGLVAQSVAKAFSSSGLDAARYGFFCYDRWDASEAQLDEFGNVVVAGEEAGDLYSVRYEEALCMEAAYMRRENARLKKRVADLEERLAALETKLS